METFTNLGPIVDMCVVDLERQGQGQVQPESQMVWKRPPIFIYDIWIANIQLTHKVLPKVRLHQVCSVLFTIYM